MWRTILGMIVKLHLTLKNFLSLVVGACVVGLALITLLVDPQHLGWARWQAAVIVLGAIAILALFVQSIIQSKDDHDIGERQSRVETSLAELGKLLSTGKPKSEVKEETLRSDDRVKLHPRDQLQKAQEAVFVDDLLEWSIADLKINLAHDIDFRNKYNAIPKGKYPKLDERKQAIALDPIIAAKFVRAHLMPRSRWADMVRNVFRAAGRTSYEAQSDFLFELHAVNITDNVTTLQDIVAEAEIGGKWVTLPRLNDLSNYQLVFEKNKEDDALFDPNADTKELDGLWDKMRDRPLVRGVGYQGWVGFELTTDSVNLEKPVNQKVRLLDALGNSHPVMTVGPRLETDWHLRHNPNADN
jgi:hypothetical protein